MTGNHIYFLLSSYTFSLPHLIQTTLFLQVTLDDATDSWGIKVERVEIKDVKLPHQLQRAMAAEAEATREARAKVKAFNLQEKRLMCSRHQLFCHAFIFVL